MNNFIYIGKIVGTHGIKGEIRILSDNEVKNQIFKPNFILYLGSNKEKVKIVTYRHHKNYEMVILEGYNNINDVIRFKHKNVYVKRDDLEIKDYLLEDLIDFEVIEDNKFLGKVRDVIKNKNNILLKIEGIANFYLPKCEEYIKQVDTKTKKIYVKNTRGLIL